MSAQRDDVRESVFPEEVVQRTGKQVGKGTERVNYSGSAIVRSSARLRVCLDNVALPAITGINAALIENRIHEIIAEQMRFVECVTKMIIARGRRGNRTIETKRVTDVKVSDIDQSNRPMYSESMEITNDMRSFIKCTLQAIICSFADCSEPARRWYLQGSFKKHKRVYTHAEGVSAFALLFSSQLPFVRTEDFNEKTGKLVSIILRMWFINRVRPTQRVADIFRKADGPCLASFGTGDEVSKAVHAHFNVLEEQWKHRNGALGTGKRSYSVMRTNITRSDDEVEEESADDIAVIFGTLCCGKSVQISCVIW